MNLLDDTVITTGDGHRCFVTLHLTDGVKLAHRVTLSYVPAPLERNVIYINTLGGPKELRVNIFTVLPHSLKFTTIIDRDIEPSVVTASKFNSIILIVILILIESMNLLQKMKSGMGSPDCP